MGQGCDLPSIMLVGHTGQRQYLRYTNEARKRRLIGLGGCRYVCKVEWVLHPATSIPSRYQERVRGGTGILPRGARSRKRSSKNVPPFRRSTKTNIQSLWPQEGQSSSLGHGGQRFENWVKGSYACDARNLETREPRRMANDCEWRTAGRTTFK